MNEVEVTIARTASQNERAGVMMSGFSGWSPRKEGYEATGRTRLGLHFELMTAWS